MKQFNQLSKILLIVVALVGLTVGMSALTGCSSTSDNAKATMNADTVESVAKEAVKDTKCGEGKCGEGKCGGDAAKAAVSTKVDEAKAAVQEGKCGGEKVESKVMEKVGEAKETVKEAKCEKANMADHKCDENCKHAGKCESKCGGDKVESKVIEKVGEVKETVKEARCGEGKCG